MKAGSVTSLGFSLLGLLQKQPQSGYDLRRLFSTTPLAHYSDSPGAIYPALNRLKEQGLVRSIVEKGAGLRFRRVFSVTPKGLARLRQWLSQPVTRDAIVHAVPELLMRFSLMDTVNGPAASVRLLTEMKRELTSHCTGLRKYLEEHGSQMPLSGRLAFDYGVRSYDALRQWTQNALAAYRKKGLCAP